MRSALSRRCAVMIRNHRLRLHYLERGEGTRPKLLWLHGMGSDVSVFWRYFHEEVFPGHMVGLDFPGFGDSQALPGRQDVPDYVAAVVAMSHRLRWEKDDRPVLVGHSFGGMVAAEALAEHPDRFQGAVLIAPAGFIPPRGEMEPTPWPWLNRLGIWLTGSEWFGRRMVRFLGMDPEAIGVEDRRRLQYGWRHAREMARMGHFYASVDLGRRLAKTGKPVVIIHGARDPLFPKEPLRYAVPSSVPIWWMEGVGHLPFFQCPAAFDRLLSDALTTVGPTDVGCPAK